MAASVATVAAALAALARARAAASSIIALVAFVLSDDEPAVEAEAEGQTTWNLGVNAFDSGVSGAAAGAKFAHASAHVRACKGMASEGAKGACE